VATTGEGRSVVAGSEGLGSARGSSPVAQLAVAITNAEAAATMTPTRLFMITLPP
jgi:hypothetical protein